MSPYKSLSTLAALALISVIAVLLGGPGFSSAVAGPAPSTPACQPNWQMVQSPNPRSSNRLESVAAVDDSDVWAVGYYFDFAQTPDHTLTLHWDGTAWTHVPSPNPVAGSYLADVVALAPDNVWAAGYQFTSTARTLVMRWDGIQWTVIPTPNQGPSTNELRAIAAVAPDDIWAAGNTPGSHNTVTMHWDGTAWTVVPSLANDFANYYVIRDMVAISTNDIWIVGYWYPESGSHRTFTLHWNGTSWTRIDPPQPGNYHRRLYGVAAVSSNEVWAVGQYSSDLGATYQTLVMKWNGTSWSQVPSPSGSPAGYSILYGVTVGTDGELWAVGKYHVQNNPTWPAHTLVLRWVDGAWHEASSPDGSRYNTELYGVTTTLSGDIWSVGRSYTAYNTPWDTTTMRNICSGGGTATPTRTATSVPLTNTPPPGLTATPTGAATQVALTPTPTPPPASPTPSATAGTVPSSTPPSPTATPGTCSIEFTDVAAGSAFYTYIRCLACQGVLSGYSDRTFRPYNNITRGQISKVVSNAAGFYEDPGAQIFEDVPTGSPFYPWVNRLSRRGYVSGYLCGGQGEPCGAGGLGYFRPNANATRGQIAKIVSNAAGYGDTPTGLTLMQLFQDVPPGHVFYPWVQRLASRGYISGYSCGGPGEPCAPPDNRAYFRPGNNATRGQVSKIVAGTFSPSCGAVPAP
jgi:hypothetical protein